MDDEWVEEAWSAERCTCAVEPQQSQLFEDGPYAGPISSSTAPRPPIETAASGHLGFWYRFTPHVFLGRRGVGPLLLALDTVVLIEFVDALSKLNEGGFLEPPSYSRAWSEGRTSAMLDLVQLWYHRDVRFLLSDTYLVDSKRPLADDQLRVRRRVIKELDFDCYGLRGGVETRLPDSLPQRLRDAIARDVAGCPVHPEMPDRASSFPAPPADVRWPTGARDRELVADALGAGAHVFLTYDRGILKRASVFARLGLVISTPPELLTHLDASGELDSWYSPLIDLDTLARIWKITETAADVLGQNRES